MWNCGLHAAMSYHENNPYIMEAETKKKRKGDISCENWLISVGKLKILSKNILVGFEFFETWHIHCSSIKKNRWYPMLPDMASLSSVMMSIHISKHNAR